MAGNVMEWTADWSSEDSYNVSPQRNPVGPDAGESRTLRGGSWYFDEFLVRCAYRFRYQPMYWDNNVGFRVVSSGL
jgi:formylglycine-generating enzyme required for sulfatase activity